MKRFQIVLILLFAMSLVLFGTGQSRLYVTRQSSNVVISWSAADSSNSILQQTRALGPSNQWIRVAQTPASNAGTFSVTLPATNAASFFRLAIFDPSAVDDPDDNFIDANGDGIDGTISIAVFVSSTGSDTNPGTMTQPVSSIAQAITNAVAQGRKHIYIAKGVYPSGTIPLRDGISLYGGYDAADWSRAAANIAQVNVAASTAVTADNITNSTTIDRFVISGADAAGAGQSAYGLFARNSPGLIVRNCLVQAGNATAGADGVNGAAGANGGNGFLGTPGCVDSSFLCGSCAQPQGGQGGTSSCGRTGGRGGNAGHDAAFGGPGSPGVGGTLGGPGTPPRGGNWNTSSNYWGANGLSGGPGANGAGGGAFTLSPNGYVPSAGTSGSSGIPGNGGGGGGGGGGGDRDCDSYGGGGGGGGGGGCGGLPGGGGQSGGASIAVFLWSSNVRIEACTLVSGSGGNGGFGGRGGAGGSGGLGASNPSLPGAGNLYGGSSEQDDGSNGGRGGDGGNGGQAGHGGGGAGGAAIGVARGADSSPQITSVSFALGTPGSGGGSPGNGGANGQAYNTYP